MTPQLENGYTKIANEIMDALAKYRIPGEQRQCLDFIIRKTYGYNKKEDCIANSQFCEATGMDKSNVSRALRNLVLKNVVVKSDNGLVPTYCFNKDYSQWCELSKVTTVVKKATVVVKDDNDLLSKVTDTKERKDNTQKKGGSGSLSEEKKGCPVQEILDLYHTILPDMPRVLSFTEIRKSYIRARWSEGKKGLGWWSEYFGNVSKSDFLCGRVKASNGRKVFVADLEWLVKPNNLAKVIEGKYNSSIGPAQDRTEAMIAAMRAGK